MTIFMGWGAGAGRKSTKQPFSFHLGKNLVHSNLESWFVMACWPGGSKSEHNIEFIMQTVFYGQPTRSQYLLSDVATHMHMRSCCELGSVKK